MFQENELVNFFTALTAAGILIFISRDKKLGGARLSNFYIGFWLTACAYLATVIEGIFWPDFFNLVEHISTATAGLFFAMGAWSLMKTEPPDSKDGC